jgi:hypothetical protein
MIDQYRFPFLDHQEPYGSNYRPGHAIQRGKEKEQWLTGHVDIIALVRSLQRAAGMADCFRIGIVDCDVTDCDWRAYCLGKSGPSPKE